MKEDVEKMNSTTRAGQTNGSGDATVERLAMPVTREPEVEMLE